MNISFLYGIKPINSIFISKECCTKKNKIRDLPTILSYININIASQGLPARYRATILRVEITILEISQLYPSSTNQRQRKMFQSIIVRGMQLMIKIF